MQTQTKHRSPRDEQKRIIWQIINNKEWRNADTGQTSWTMAMEAHPEWRTTLNWGNAQSRRRISVMAAFLRKHGLPEQLKQPQAVDLGAGRLEAPAAAAPVQTNGAAAANGASVFSRKAAVLEIIEKWTKPNGYVDYVGAFTAHPEWMEPFKITDVNNFKQFKLVQSAVGYRKMHMQKKKKGRELAVVAEVVQPEMPKEIYLRNCPGCGQAIGGLDEVLTLMAEHPEVLQLALAAAKKMLRGKLAH